jgi:hypothetical protein
MESFGKHDALYIYIYIYIYSVCFVYFRNNCSAGVNYKTMITRYSSPYLLSNNSGFIFIDYKT